MRSLVASGAALLATTFVGNVSAQDIYLESNGYVAIEAESAQIVSDWVEHDPEVDDARGKAMRFTGGASICSTNANTAREYPTLDYHVRITTAGTYRLKMNIFKQIHCVSEGSDGASCHSGAGCQSMGVQSDGDSCDGANQCWRSDISNDAYVNVETADGMGVDYVGGGDQIMKFFGGNGSRYAWSGDSALDHNNPDYDLMPGDYVIKVRGRSRGFSFDRLILYRDNQNDAKNADESEIYVAPIDPGKGGTPGTGGTDGGVTDPTDPGNGGDPSTDPTDPSTPTDPTDPTDPTTGTPTDPTDPGTVGAGDGDSDPATGEDAEPTEGSSSSSDTGGCSVTTTSGGPNPLFWMSMLGLFAWATRRRRTT